MKKSRYTEKQISYALRQADTGTPVAEVIRRMGVSEQTFYRWKKLYAGLDPGSAVLPAQGHGNGDRIVLVFNRRQTASARSHLGPR